jgi:hypothetical protein
VLSLIIYVFSIQFIVPKQRYGYGGGVFICQYELSMMQQWYYRFNVSKFHEKPLLYDFVSPPAFDFNPSDTDNFRNHLKRLLGNLCVVYQASTKAVSDAHRDRTTDKVNGGKKDCSDNSIPACHGGSNGELNMKIM